MAMRRCVIGDAASERNWISRRAHHAQHTRCKPHVQTRCNMRLTTSPFADCPYGLGHTLRSTALPFAQSRLHAIVHREADGGLERPLDEREGQALICQGWTRKGSQVRECRWQASPHLRPQRTDCQEVAGKAARGMRCVKSHQGDTACRGACVVTAWESGAAMRAHVQRPPTTPSIA